ncbi:hypothetical protein OZN62_02755 [Aurantiacibacter sp. MUD11]|uniref:hypothetical protein n=1 Tax=Aurantiacibacter sp. MUD11 TaxID=3003265 RepID=UPI0022AAB7CF|nr:hypothetical protein [Aurantiacibacter sp. MUD11]WAT18518.1 hypothetical protein OZN62_02755 [Aurantiacibacter sp. MUD11]
MRNHDDINLAEKFAAAQDWWRGAGVDYDFTDEAMPLLADEEEAAPTPLVKQAAAEDKAEEPPAPKLSATDLPDELPAFREWWMGADNPFSAPASSCIPPRGEAGAPVMVVVPMPEAGDSDMLLSGVQGLLVGNILRAIGIDPDAAYLASALPAHMPLPDFEALGREGLGAALTQHIQLAQPQRVLLLGSKLPGLLGHDPSSPPESLTDIGGTKTLATFAPDRLLDHARQRARLWKRLLQWTNAA